MTDLQQAKEHARVALSGSFTYDAIDDYHTFTMKAQYLSDHELASVMVSADGTRLCVLSTDGAISRVEPGTGRDLGVVARLPSAVVIVRID